MADFIRLKLNFIRFLSHTSGELGVTYALHLSLVGKHVVDFLFAIIEHFSLALTVFRQYELIMVEVGIFLRSGGSL